MLQESVDAGGSRNKSLINGWMIVFMDTELETKKILMQETIRADKAEEALVKFKLEIYGYQGEQ